MRIASPFQRERIKVRVSSNDVPPEQTRSPAEHHQVLCALDYSKIVGPQFHGERGIRCAFDPGFGRPHNCVRHHPIPPRASQSDNKNRECKDRKDADVEIYSRQERGSGDFAKEYVRRRLLSCEASEHDSQQIIKISRWRYEKRNSVQPLTSILSPRPGRGGLPVAEVVRAAAPQQNLTGTVNNF